MKNIEDSKIQSLAVSCLDIADFCNKAETWCILGNNGEGIDNVFSKFSNYHSTNLRVAVLSLERVSELIQQERKRDLGDFSSEGIDTGRTALEYLKENVSQDYLQNDFLIKFDSLITLFDIGNVLHRGLRFLSSGEMRRVLLCAALLEKSDILLLKDIFDGLDIHSREVLEQFFLSSKNVADNLIFFSGRHDNLPAFITHVCYIREQSIVFCGPKAEYVKNILPNTNQNHSFIQEYKKIQSQSIIKPEKTQLVSMNHVTVGWADTRVLTDFSWTLYSGEHWLVKGPNGSGKTTFLELITGDNMQVFSNDISLFGKRRGSGETVWEIKKRLGIVSHRLHIEHTMLSSITIEQVIVSGFFDSIGLYEIPSDKQIMKTDMYLKLAGFYEKKQHAFLSLSYGEQRIVLILRAVVKSPDILILDEPCQGIDSVWKEKILSLLTHIANNERSTLIHVTHDISEQGRFEHKLLELLPLQNPSYRITDM